MNKHFLLISFCLFALGTQAQNVTIPDANFKAALIAKGVDTNTDNNIQVSEAQAVTSLIVNGKSISDLTGIEAFTSLLYLDCHENRLSSINVSKNTALTFLNCEFNALTGLDVSKNINLTNLRCSSNQIAAINISTNVLLTFFNCCTNTIAVIDVSKNTNLTFLGCCANKISVLDVTKNILLENIGCYDNKIAVLDLTKNTKLKQLDCSTNKIAALDLTQCPNLIQMKSMYNDPLTQICITSAQLSYANSYPASWSKDFNTKYNTTCGITTDIEDLTTSSETKILLKVCTVLGEEVNKDRAVGGVFLYLYSDGSVEKIAKF